MSLLMAAQGAKFMAMIRKSNDQFLASCEITLQTGDKTESETHTHIFDTLAEAEAWLNAESRLRGFE